jgi:hypothetical protein
MLEKPSKIERELGAQGEAIQGLKDDVSEIKTKLDTALAYIHQQQGRRTVLAVIWAALVSGLVSWLFQQAR